MLQVQNLHISFRSSGGNGSAVKNLSFQVQRGEVLGIAGESGSGKSVTSLAVMRLLNPAQTQISGSILLDGTDLLSLSEKQMRSIRGNRIAMIFQEPMTSLNPVLTCGYQVQEALFAHQKMSKKAARQAVIDLFNEVRLPRPEAVFGSYPSELSGGQRQRVMIAVALACNPELLIADEPTTALDATVQKTIIDLLLKLKAERNLSMIFISHDIGVISKVASHVLVMYKGNCIEQAPAATLLQHPQRAYTQSLLACRPSPALQLKHLPVITDFIATDNNGNLQATGTNLQTLIKDNEYSQLELISRKQQLYRQQPVLTVSNLAIWYPVKRGLFGKPSGFVKAVDGVSFEVYPGETLGLVGESGSGKSTLGRSLLRLIEPTAGQIIYKGQNLLKLNPRELRSMRRHMQIIFQDPYSSLNPRITVGNAIMEPLQAHGLYRIDTKRRQKTAEILERVGLSPDNMSRYPHEFSGGQRQRIVIAKALILQPEFIICDESVSALDVSVQAQVLNLLKELQRDFNLTYIFISHDLAVIKHVSDRIMVMHKGRMEEIGDADQVYNRPQNSYTKKLIASVPGYHN